MRINGKTWIVSTVLMLWLISTVIVFFLGIQLWVYVGLSHNSLLLLTLGLELVLCAIIIVLLRRYIHEHQHCAYLDREVYTISSKLQEEQSRFESIFESTSISAALLKLDGSFLRVNNSVCELLGYNKSELLTKNFYHFISQTDLTELQIQLQGLIEKKRRAFEFECQCFRKNGDTLWIRSTLSLITDDTSKPLYFIIQIQNITLQKRAEERLHHMAYHDPLTGLDNRNKLEQFINHTLASARRYQQVFALLFLDLDRFKNINDTIGHEAGDTILQIIADRLRASVRSTDMVARLGGDEFVLLITDVKRTESVALIAQKVLENMLEVITVKGQEIYLTTSIGISLYPYDGQNLQTLMKHADLALYRAKDQGRNNYQFYTVEMTSSAQEKMALQNALGHALAKSEFQLHYQPKMHIRSRHITGIEAFLRWKNEDYGAVTPNEIVALAEETGLIIPVSEWVLRTACKALKHWHEMGFTSLTIAVNCSARQFRQSTFVDDTLQTITEVGIPPSSLEIEVIESTIMEDPENTLRILYALKDLGIKIVIDDFGTGYWSLNNLKRLAVDKIKIDKTFIKQIMSDEVSATITTAIIAMANKLGITSIAEGVETREQYQFLDREGCTEIQGYYLTQPLPNDQITKFLHHPVPDAEAISMSEIDG